MSEPWTSTLRRPLANLAGHLPESIKDIARPVARRLHLAAPAGHWWTVAPPLWTPPTRAESRARARCNICHWFGDRFEGIAHVESASCPRCGSIARDRFLLWCFARQGRSIAGLRVLETSPRLGLGYRTFMRRSFGYRASDYDLSAHVADIRLDLHNIDLPNASVDVVLTPHVLEHVPDTGRALAELFRIIAPGGRMYLQVPLLQGTTGVPRTPEFHADNTPVFFRFGWDLTDQVRKAGFAVDVQVTAPFHSWLVGRSPAPACNGDGFDIDSLTADVRPADLAVVTNDEHAAQLGFEPSYHFVTWACRRLG